MWQPESLHTEHWNIFNLFHTSLTNKPIITTKVFAFQDHTEFTRRYSDSRPSRSVEVKLIIKVTSARRAARALITIRSTRNQAYSSSASSKSRLNTSSTPTYSRATLHCKLSDILRHKCWRCTHTSGLAGSWRRTTGPGPKFGLRGVKGGRWMTGRWPRYGLTGMKARGPLWGRWTTGPWPKGKRPLKCGKGLALEKFFNK